MKINISVPMWHCCNNAYTTSTSFYGWQYWNLQYFTSRLFPTILGVFVIKTPLIPKTPCVFFTKICSFWHGWKNQFLKIIRIWKFKAITVGSWNYLVVNHTQKIVALHSMGSTRFLTCNHQHFIFWGCSLLWTSLLQN